MPLPKEKRKYIIDNQIIMQKWDYVENEKIGLDPTKITQGSHQKAYFICPDCGNKWFGVIRDLLKYNCCKVCMKKARSTSNAATRLKTQVSLFVSNPELKAEWDFDENQKFKLFPETIMAGTNKKAHWICPLGHKYEAYISNRAKKHTGCPYCSGQSVLKGFNDLATTRPDLLAEWDYEKNLKLGVSPEHVMKGSHITVNWICPFGHHYVKEIKVRCSGQGCTICSKESQTSFPEQAIFFYLSNIFPDTQNRYGKPEIDIYVPSLKLGIEYDGTYAHKKKAASEERKNRIIAQQGILLIRIKETSTFKTDEKYTIYCKPNSNNTFLNEVLKKLEERINTAFGIDISINSDIVKDRIKIEEQYISLRKADSIAKLFPQIAMEWDYDKNGEIKPEYITCGSHRKYFWICEKGHSYTCSPRDRINGRGCQICSGYNFIRGINDFQTKYPELEQYWDYDKNEVNPFDIKYTSSKMFWWKCANGHSYQTTLKTMIKYHGCLGCIKNIPFLVKGVNDLLTIHPTLASEWDYSKNPNLPSDYSPSSNKIVWWRCAKCGHEWESIINHRPQCPMCRKKAIMINVYSIDSGNLIGAYPGPKILCEKMGFDYNKQKGNIISICKRIQKTLCCHYILRYDKDDEFKELTPPKRIQAFNELIPK